METISTTARPSISSRPRHATLPGALVPWCFRGGLVAIALYAALLPYWLRAFTLDDGAIAWRYARNILRGAGWVYNPGELVNASTSPLHTLLLALLSAPSGNIPLTGHMLDCACLGLAGVLTALWLRDRGWPLAGVLAGVLIVSQPLYLASIGLETALELVLVSGALLAYGRRRWTAAAVLLALLVLARTDGVILAGCLALGHLIRWRRGAVPLPWRAVALALLVPLPWLIFSWRAFGSPLPNTLGAKIAQGQSGYWGDLATQFWFFVHWVGAFDLLPWQAPLALVGAVAVLAHRLWWLVPVLGFGALHYAAYVWLGVAAYHWYYAPLCYAGVLLVALGADASARALGSLVTRLAPATVTSAERVCVGRGVQALTGGTLLVVLAWTQLVAPDGSGLRAQGVAARYGRGTAYALVSTYLRRTTTPDTTVAAAEIGVIGWDADRPIVDYLGLLSPTRAADVRAGDLHSWVAETTPDVIVLHAPVWPIEAQARELPWFTTAYALTATIRDPSGQTLTVWTRQRSPAAIRQIATR